MEHFRSALNLPSLSAVRREAALKPRLGNDFGVGEVDRNYKTFDFIHVFHGESAKFRTKAGLH